MGRRGLFPRAAPCYIRAGAIRRKPWSIAMASAAESKPSGVYAAVLTPLTKDLEPDPTLFVAQCRWLLENGCDGLAPLGTTGEANSLSVNQRIMLIEAAASGGLPMAKFIPGAGSCALADAVKV